MKSINTKHAISRMLQCRDRIRMMVYNPLTPSKTSLLFSLFLEILRNQLVQSGRTVCAGNLLPLHPLLCLPSFIVYTGSTEDIFLKL